jgi:membrane protease YdiL (CAAX protease family)
MLNRHRALRSISRKELRWKELLFWTLLLAAYQSLESGQLRRQITGFVEAIAFVAVAISSLGKLDGLGLEFICWKPIGFRGATVSMAIGFSAGALVVLVALLFHQALGVDSGWNKVALAIVLGPVVEEVIFRGYCMTAALRLLARGRSGSRRNCLAVGAVALIFMLAHGGRLGITTVQLCCIVVTGTLYGIIRLRQQSTVAAVLAHGCYNLVLYMAFWIGLSA